MHVKESAFATAPLDGLPMQVSHPPCGRSSFDSEPPAPLTFAITSQLETHHALALPIALASAISKPSGRYLMR
jgi:hypothetical protein